eukprot:scaffold10312_cov141-Skeletonema_marinoi.AAC.12
MDNKEEHTTTADSADSDVYLADGSSSGSLKEEEKVEEDAIVDRLAKTQPESNNAQLKTPEDENSGNNETSDVYEEMKLSAHQNNEEATDVNVQHVHKDMQQNDNEEATLPQEGTVAEIPEDNFNSAHEDAAVFSDNGGDERSVVVPGFMFIAGPDYTGTGIHTGYVSGSEDGNINEGAVILQGFLPEDDPLRRRRSRAESTREQRIRERVQRLIDNAITLDDSAVRPIPFEGDGDEENNGLDGAQSNSSGRDDYGVAKSDNCRWFLPLLVILIAAGIILAIALPLSMRGKSESANEEQDTTGTFSDADCLPGGVEARFELAKSILSNITSPDLVEDESTPQGKAIRWIVCDDSISVQLLENQDTSTGNLPKQKHGFRLGGNAGDAQVTRRYILAAFFYSTSQVSPWNDSLNFLSPDLHECNWHKNYTRSNFPFGDFDPVGVFCTIDKGELSSPISITEEFLLNDDDYPLSVTSNSKM